MDWEIFKVDRFAKLMAMAFSAQGNEASSALRLAALMMNQAGGSFDDIAEILRQSDVQALALPKNNETLPKNNETLPKNNETLPKNNETLRKNNEAVSKNNEALSKNNGVGRIVPTPMAARPSDWLTGVILERLARAEARATILSQENEAFKKQLDDAIRYIVELESAVARPSGRM